MTVRRKKLILPRSAIHAGTGFLNAGLYFSIDQACGHASLTSLLVALLVLIGGASFVTWADIMKLYIGPKLEDWYPRTGGLLWLRQGLWHSFNIQRRWQLAAYKVLEREHEKEGFLAATHYGWGLVISFLLLWLFAPAQYHLFLYLTVSLIVAGADPAAAYGGYYSAGTQWEKPLPIVNNPHKSIGGSMWCFTVAAAISYGMFLLTPLNEMIARPLPSALLVGAFSALGEALGSDQPYWAWPRIRDDDNLVIVLFATFILLVIPYR